MDVDEEFDKALAAAGLLKKNNLAKENVNTVNKSSNGNATEKGDEPLYSKCYCHAHASVFRQLKTGSFEKSVMFFLSFR